MESSGSQSIDPCKIIIPVCVLVSGIVCLSSTVTSIMIYKGQLSAMWKDTSIGIMGISGILFMGFCILFIRQAMRTCCRIPSEEEPEYVIAQYLRRILGVRVGDFQITNTESPTEDVLNVPSDLNDAVEAVSSVDENHFTNQQRLLETLHKTNEECAEAKRIKDKYTKTE